MASSDEKAAPTSIGSHTSTVEPAGVASTSAPVVERPRTPTADRDTTANGQTAASNNQPNPPTTPAGSTAKKPPNATTPRVKKKVPWKGKSVFVLLPEDEERGLPGKAPIPLNESAVAGMLRSWQQLGYSIDGFDLYPPAGDFGPSEQSQSKGAWPDPADLALERKQGGWKVLLPDLNAWKRYVDELNEAKLRALGVSFGDEDPPPPSISPASTNIAQYPPLPFSPPVPPSSASSNQAVPGFPFPSPFVTSAAQSPGISAGASPSPFGVKYNPRASISIPSPHAWSQQLMLHQGHRVDSPSLANLNAIMSPASPFSADGIAGTSGHQRHQSLQFSALPHQFQAPSRVSPRLQELREVDEEAVENEGSKPSGSGFVRLNPNDTLQKEIDEAEYHLEEQMRSQLENDVDYSPHNENGKGDSTAMGSALGNVGDQSVQFAPQPPRFAGDADGLVLHHPRPHSRGHSLSQKYFTEDDATKEGGFRPTLQRINAQTTEDDEIETNPSNLGTPVQALDFSKLMHQRGFSTASNPWVDHESGNSAEASHQVHPNHGGKSSFSKLNVEAPEFKFNPTSNFQPGAFAFSPPSFQPMTFNIGMSQVDSNQTGFSKINVNAPVFSPSQSDFSFTASGPKFRPDAPAFTPHSFSTAVTSPVMSGAESGSQRASSIFGNIDLSASDVIKPAKKSKAIPIVRPESRGEREDADDRRGPANDNDARVKRARARAGDKDDDDAVPQFAEPSKEDAPTPEDIVPVEEKSFEESNPGLVDTTMSSTMVSETTNTKATVSPAETSPDQGAVKWAPFEFKDTADMQSFNDARPFGTDTFKPAHKKSLSATAKAFVPGAAWEGPAEVPVDAATDDLASHAASQSGAALDTDATPQDEVVGATLDQAIEEEQVAESVEKSTEGGAAPTVIVPVEPSPPVKGLAASRYARDSPSPPPLPPRTGLAASRFAATPPPARHDKPQEEALPGPKDAERAADHIPLEPSMADIDEVMRRLHANPDMGVNRTYDQPQWHQHSPVAEPELSPAHLPPQTDFRSDAPSPSLDQSRKPASLDLEDPFVDPPRSARSIEGAIHRLNGNESIPTSDWEGVFSEGEQTKLESRIAFFDGRVNELVGGLLAARLGPLEQMLNSINNALVGNSKGIPPSRQEQEHRYGVEGEQTGLGSQVPLSYDRVNELVGGLLAARLEPLEHTLDSVNNVLVDLSRRTGPSRQERRSASAEIQESDADDEDDDAPATLRSISPRRDRRMEQIRAAVLDAFAAHRRNQPKESSPAPAAVPGDNSVVIKALEEIKDQLNKPQQPAFTPEEFKNIVDEVVERRIPPAPVDGNDELISELRARIAELEQKVQVEEAKADAAVAARRAAENRAAEIDRELQSAATRVEVELMNKTAMNQRIADLEERAQHAEYQAEQEVKTRRAAEDRLSEVQRLLRISSEEETRLRELVDEKDQKIKSAESAQSETAVRLSLLEASQVSAQQSQSESQNRINALEAEAREARREAQHWRGETDRIVRIIQQRDKDLAQALDENKALHKLIDTLGTQLQENERVRDTWRAKFISMQEEMAQAAREITEENARRAKKEQALLARQEVLEARLQAEARTRERIETELERLEMGERQSMRAVAECKRLEGVLAELRTENHKLHQTALRYQAEFQEARESAAREVQRTRDAMQAEVDNANHQVNVVREELEDQMARLRSQLDQVKLDADTARARHEMLLEEAQNSKEAAVEELSRKHQNEVEDLQARYERQLSNTTEDAQRAEQNLLERLSISTSKSEYLQDKVAHLEERLEIAKEAARAAAQAAKSVSGGEAVSSQHKPAAARQLEPPEKISPQALRESIMVLQEQLQEREQRIEELETKLSKTDPEAAVKISKRDDEITWLRELLAVRHSDLQDIITALGQEDYDRNAVKDAAIRLKANLQMEEQERERAMNGGSAINLPNIAATIRDAATPRVAQAVGPLAAAWGSWRKARDAGLGSVLSSPAPLNGSNSTPSRTGSGQRSGLLGGFLATPASHMRQNSNSQQPVKQPTAFSSTGRRFTAQDLANRPRPPPQLAASSSANNSQKGEAVEALSATAAATTVPATPTPAGQETPPRRTLAAAAPVTPPMMRSSAYDEDAQATEDFDDGGFFEEN